LVSVAIHFIYTFPAEQKMGSPYVVLGSVLMRMLTQNVVSLNQSYTAELLYQG